MSGQLHAPAALPLGKDSRYVLDRKLGGVHSRSGPYRDSNADPSVVQSRLLLTSWYLILIKRRDNYAFILVFLCDERVPSSVLLYRGTEARAGNSKECSRCQIASFIKYLDMTATACSRVRKAVTFMQYIRTYMYSYLWNETFIRCSNKKLMLAFKRNAWFNELQ
jgi:hypothetical protein